MAFLEIQTLPASPGWLFSRNTRTVLCQDVEEADARIIPHAMHAVKNGVFTDVFILLMHYWNVLHSNGLSEIRLKVGVDSKDTFQFTP